MDVYIDNENHYMRGVELKDSLIPGRTSYYWFKIKIILNI